MAENKGEETTSRGNDWEVVSLTASAYDAAPSSQVELKSNDKDNVAGEDEAETSRAMFMSGHFVFPPSQHENLPLEPENMETHDVQGVEDGNSELGAVGGSRLDAKGEEKWTMALTAPDEFSGIHSTDFEERTTVEGLNLVESEQSLYDGANFSSIHTETTLGGSIYDDNLVSPELIEHSGDGLDSDISQFPKAMKEDSYDGPDLPCEAWWKRRAASLYAHAKEANTFWSICVAAAVMGLVILGQQWRRESWQVLQQKWRFSINDEKLSRMMGPLSRFKDVIVGGSRRGSFIRGTSSSTER